jgi:hypothetical protein
MTETTSNTTHTQDPSELLTAAQVAAEFFGGHIKPKTLASWRSKHRARPLPYVRIGNLAFYRRSDVRAFIAAGVVTTPSK